MSACPQSLTYAEPVPTILVAEDEVLVRGLVTEHLRNAGFQVIDCANAAEAVEVLQSGVPVDLVFTDIGLPGVMNGAMLARWIYLHRPDVRVALASGAPDSARAFPNERLFVKPYDLYELAAWIRDAVGK